MLYVAVTQRTTTRLIYKTSPPVKLLSMASLHQAISLPCKLKIIRAVLQPQH